MQIKSYFGMVWAGASFFATAGCLSGSTPFNANGLGVNNLNHLYVVSGACYGGGVTVSTGPSNVITSFNLNSGQLELVLVDYNQASPGDSPVAVQDYDANHVLVLVENASGRRIDLVNKDGSGFSTYLLNSTALSSVTRDLAFLPDASILVSKSGAIEKFNAGKARILSGANPFINAPAGSCATATTLISSMAVHPTTGKIVFTHAAATPNNRIGVVSATGYAVAADCNSGVAAPTTTAKPTRAIFHPSVALLLAFGSTTLASNFIYTYAFNAVSGVLGAATLAYGDGGVNINGPSSMAADPTTGDVFVANVTSTFNTIERLHYTGGTLSRATTTPFVPSSAYTRCVADMLVAE